MLDDIIRKPAVKQEETWLPKGLNVHTMNEIKAYMRLQEGAQSAEEVANALGIARVTARRYLDFLERRRAEIRYAIWRGRTPCEQIYRTF